MATRKDQGDYLGAGNGGAKAGKSPLADPNPLLAPHYLAVVKWSQVMRQMPENLYLNLELLRQKAADIRQALGLLRGYARIEQEKFLQDPTLISAAKYQLVVAIEAAQGICNHLAARVARRAPTSYADCFALLADSQVISGDLAKSLAAMARFRNLLVHRYGEIDDRRVIAVLQEDLDDLEEYLRQVGDFVERVLGGGREEGET